MKIKLMNRTRKKKLAKAGSICESTSSKARGLMFTSRKGFQDRALIFTFSRSAARQLHMFFVFYAIDVLFLDEKRRIVEIKERFKPFTVYSPREKSKYIIELPAGTVQRTGTRIGDAASW